MCVIAYGQTGSGKTHSLVGKLGVFKNPPSDNLDNLDDNLGMFPRTALALYQGLQAKPEKSFMTITICEAVWLHPMDLTTKKSIWMDPNTNELMGGTEHLIESYKDIFRLGAIFESERTVGSTKFNATSSRTHALIWIRIYQKTGKDSYRMNHVKILDLAGSERSCQVADNDPTKLDGQFINFTLTMLSQIVEQLLELKSPVTDGKEIPRHIRWKQFFLTRVVKEAFNGLALTQFVFCAKQHDHNSGETYSTMKYAERFKKFQGKVCKPKTISISKQITFLEKRHADLVKRNERMMATKRVNKIQGEEDRVGLNKSFLAADEFQLKILRQFAEAS